jgi:hypothetical protein
LEENRLKINAIKCKKCGDIIYSRCHHDFHWCGCCSCAVDGGFDYFKITGQPSDWEAMEINILENKSDEEAKKILYNDWNKDKNKYGTIVNKD